MSAEVLRRAASLMRERAEAATPGPWSDGPHFQRANCASIFAGRRTDAHYLAMYATTANAEHIASWHPAVALAVADWLDGVALFVEARDDEEWFDLDGDPIAPEDTHAIGSALAVARAYLGSES